MPLMLWADVPTELKFRLRDERLDGFTSSGLPNDKRCVAAVRSDPGWYQNLPHALAFRRCDSRSKVEGLCAAHAMQAGLVEEKSQAEMLLNKAIHCVQRHRLTLPEFRALSDADILKIRNVGQTMAVLIREMRDTWTDARVCDAMRWPLPAPAVAASPSAFWSERPDVFAVMGG